jgi:hypothetical protein
VKFVEALLMERGMRMISDSPILLALVVAGVFWVGAGAVEKPRRKKTGAYGVRDPIESPLEDRLSCENTVID